jgi:hypothetical protein
VVEPPAIVLPPRPNGLHHTALNIPPPPPLTCSTEDSLRLAVDAAVSRAAGADVQDLPAVVHQLLVLSGRGCRDHVLVAIAGLMEARNALLEGGEGNRDEAVGTLMRRQFLEVRRNKQGMGVRREGVWGEQHLEQTQDESGKLPSPPPPSNRSRAAFSSTWTWP